MNNKFCISDLHIHSRFSRACSKALSIDNLEKWAKIKGVDLLGTGDFCHPQWSQELKNELKEDENGILRTKTGFPFLWTNEISLMYTQGGKGRRVHFVLLAPNKGVVEQITEFLKQKGRLDYDGRPIFGFSAIDLVENLMSISKDIEIIPAHCLTPYFGVFGSKSGFNSLEECFQDKVKYIHSVESGMSADPKMLWNFSFLNNKTIVSFSDSHSFWPWRIGRESTIFDLNPNKMSYRDIIKQIRENKVSGTIETNPAYGKYHWDGHRNCNFSCSPEETKKLNNTCPKCKKLLTIGVEYRVEELGDQSPEDYPSKKEFYKVLPLHELISFVYGIKLLSSKKIWEVYNKLINGFGNEFNILLKADEKDLIKYIDRKLADVILKNREGKLYVQPGYDGVYGKLVLSDNKQLTSF